MNHKAWLIAFGVIAFLLIGGGAFYAISSYGKYSEELSGWSSRVGTIESLERRIPYPNKANAEALAEKVEEYEASVQKLYQGLNSFQRPLNLEIQGTQLQPKIKESVQEFREFAKAGGLVIEGTEEFQLGFDAYASSSIPAPDVVPILDYELEAIEHLLRELVTSGVSSLKSFERDSIPGEAGSSGQYESGVVHKYPVRLRFQSPYAAFQKFVNQIANDKNYFYIVRVLKIENEATDGPPKQTQDVGFGGSYIHAATGEEPTEQERIAWGYGVAPEEEVAEAARADGFVSTQQDARVLMGQELLDVYMVVDIVRFVDPSDTASGDTDKSKEENDKKR